jgi:hypothetical protein
MKATELLAMLNDPSAELDWDDRWDILISRNEELKSCVPELLQILEGGTEIAQIFALRKLRELNVDLALWEAQLCRHLAGENYGVRLEALASAKGFLMVSPQVRRAVRDMKNRGSEYLGPRLRAWWYLFRAEPPGYRG